MWGREKEVARAAPRLLVCTPGGTVALFTLVSLEGWGWVFLTSLTPQVLTVVGSFTEVSEGGAW